MSQSTSVMVSQTSPCRHSVCLSRNRRRGSTLLVVVALMGMLALLGITFFAFASQQLESSKNYQKAAELINDPELGPDVYFDWALRQLTVGPGVLEKNSALFGGHMSLLPNAFGTDVHPHSGSGLRLSQTPTYTGANLTALPAPFVDLNGNGVQDPWERKDYDNDSNFNDLMWLNRSPSAHVVVPGGGDPNYALEISGTLFPEPDVNYTYPDINNAYLAHSAQVPYQEFDQNGNMVVDPNEDLNGNGVFDGQPYLVRIMKPSFWRPELFQRVENVIGGAGTNEDTNGDGVFDPSTEDTNGNGFWDINDFNGDGNADAIARLDPTWYWAPWSAGRSLRPHPEHYYVPSDATIPPIVKRFLNDNDPVDVPLIAGLPGGSKGFPFAGPRDASGIITGATSLSNGAWSGLAPEAIPSRFDADADGDTQNGNEAILMDLDFPVQERPSDGALYIPLFAFTIYDGDGLINLNTAGNLSGDAFPPGPTGYFGNGAGFIPAAAPGQFKTITQSNQGVSPSEVNPAWALDAIPIDAGNPSPNQTVDVVGIGDYLSYFGRAPIGNGSDAQNRWELANMELWWARKGRIEFGGTLPELHAGLLGDTSRLWNALQVANSAGTSIIDQYVPSNVPNSPGLAEQFFPFAGNSDRDDNRDSNAGGKPFGNQGQRLAARHPISFDGRGRINVLNNPRQLDLFQMGGGNPTQFQRYTQFGIAGDVDLRSSGPGVGSNLMRTAPGISGTTLGNNFRRHTPGPDGIWNNSDDEYILIDDMNEIVLEPRKASRPTDEYHRPAESGVLHMSKSDIDNTGVTRRLQNLMPGNINPNDASQEANERRRRFTVLSWDRKQFNLSRILGPGADGQPGVAGVDDNRNGFVDDPGELGWPLTDDLRAWEFSGDVDGDKNFEFPPSNFSGSGTTIGPYAGYHPNSPFPGVNPAGTYSPDPFRPQLRRLLEVEYGNRDELKLQFRLNINLLLDVVRSNNGVAHPYYSPLEYRPLTAHADDTGLTSITNVAISDATPRYPPQNSEDREFWARFDRQRMARDIYVMLYMLGGGFDNFDYRTSTGGPIGGAAYSDVQTRQMAQFAVNVVDSLDRDNVMTMFEYDTDLSDGWGLDDQPWNAAGNDPDTADRDLVFGVEAQEIAFSETLWGFQAEYTGGAVDNPATRYDETSQDHHHLFMELRSVAPRNVPLFGAKGDYDPATDPLPTVSSTHANSAWRIRRRDTDNINNVRQATFNNTVTAPDNAIYFKADTGNNIDPGEAFTIATADNDNGDNMSDLYVDVAPSDPMITQKLMAPYDPLVSPPSTGLPSPQCNLDLVSNDASHTSRFGLENNSTTDEFLNATTAPTGGAATRFTLVLERRLDPTQVQLPVTVNPWITVDVITPRRRSFNLLATDTTQAAIEGKLQNLTSRERREPLDNRERNGTGDGTQRMHSLRADSPSLASYGAYNTTGNNPHTIVQAHFDRDFVSSIELMNVPVNGPGHQTRALRKFNLSPYDQLLGPGNTANDEGPFTAAALFLMPSPPNQTGSSGSGNYADETVAFTTRQGGDPQRLRYRNHWHRLLELVEVPTRTHLQLGGPFATTRVPGRINLNTIRHPEVLGALIDDPELFSPPAPNAAPPRFGLPGRAGNDSSRDWWFDLLWSRDGLHPENLLTLPGMPYSKPFKGIGESIDNTAVSEPTSDTPVSRSPVEETILRSHPDQSTPSPRGLFDVGTAGNANSNNIDHHNRRRILSKILGNSATRSNAFYVFVHVQFHEVYEQIDGTGNAHFRIGGRIDLNNDTNLDDGHRGFFVIDRSDAEEAYDSRTGKFEWKHLVKHRLTIN